MALLSKSCGLRVFCVVALAGVVGRCAAMEQTMQENTNGGSQSLAKLSRGEIFAAVRKDLQARITEESALDATRDKQVGPFYRDLSDEFKDSAPLVVTGLAQDDGSQLETVITAAGSRLLFYIPGKTLDIFHVAFLDNAIDTKKSAEEKSYASRITALAVLTEANGKMLLMGTQQGQVRFFEPNKNYPMIGSVEGEVLEIVPNRLGEKIAVCFATADSKRYAAVACFMKKENANTWLPFSTVPVDRADVTDVSFDTSGLLYLTTSSGEKEIWNFWITKSNRISLERIQGRR